MSSTHSDELDALNSEMERLFGEAKYTEAHNVARAFVAATEAMETATAGGPGLKSAEALGELAWYALHARKFDEALAAADRAASLAPDQIWLATNRAHALLFLGRIDEARALYLGHKGQRLFPDSDKPWEDVIAEDFETLRKAGLDHAAFGEIVAALGINRALDQEVRTLSGQVHQLYGEGKYAEAIPLAERYVVLARERNGEERTEFATAIGWLGVAYYSQGRYREAEPLLNAHPPSPRRLSVPTTRLSALRSTALPNSIAPRAATRRPSHS
jgi:tetratricopeptide (TPR) repeat protein